MDKGPVLVIAGIAIYPVDVVGTVEWVAQPGPRLIHLDGVPLEEHDCDIDAALSGLLHPYA